MMKDLLWAESQKLHRSKILWIAGFATVMVGLIVFAQGQFTFYDRRYIDGAGSVSYTHLDVYKRQTGYMLHKCWTGAYCRYFREAVLPLNLELQASLTTEGISPELRACAVCGKA